MRSTASWLVAMVLAMLLGGCAGVPTAPSDCEGRPFDPQLHAIYINQFGELKLPNVADPAPSQAQDDILTQKEDAYAARIIDHFKELRAGRPQLRLTIFVHGGLNTFDTAWKRAAQFSCDMLRDGQYAVFIGWNSGAFTNYFDHLFRIRAGEYNPRRAVPTSPIVVIGDLARSIVNIPEAWYRTVADPATVSTWYTNHVEVEVARRIGNLERAGFRVSNQGPYRGVAGSYWTILNPVKLLTAPAVDGVGSGSWDSMLRRTDLVLSKPIAYEGRLPQQDAPAAAPTPPGVVPAVQKEAKEMVDTAVTRFLKEWLNDGTLADVPISLIGHSMGAIVANNILARHPALNFDNVVFMGAAARIKDIENGVVPWMRRPDRAGARFYNLSLDPYREISENEFYDFVPRGSLLHWIDNIFGEVNSFKDRTAGGWWNIVRTAADVFPESVRQRVYLTRFPIGASDKGPQEHGDFDSYCFWRPAYWTAGTPLLAHPACAATLRTPGADPAPRSVPAVATAP